MNTYQQFIFYRTYSRWNEKERRRETWEETVGRYIDYMASRLGDKLEKEEYTELKDAIIALEVMPSMRLLWSAGEAVEKSNAAAYNCSYIAPQKWQDFGEILYLLTCGCGVGFSCEQHIVDALPVIKKQTGEWKEEYSIPDSRIGWADALVYALKWTAEGYETEFDYTKIRPAGARLKTMGGRASGPGPLIGLIEFAKEKIKSRQGQKLRPIDVHDIICKIGDVVVSGGVRRSSEISLSDLKDEDMRGAKTGAFYVTEPQRSMANNSAVYATKPTQAEFMKEWLALMESGTGERGIFNRGGLEEQMPTRRWKKSHDYIDFMGTNPCGEITLRSKEFCNLTEVVARETDTKKSLLRKVRLASILGTYQSMFSDFQYLSDEWKKNCEDERLLGVSITGQYDCPVVRNANTLRALKECAVDTNREYAERFGIKPSASVTCVKPSGTVSQLVNASSGLHSRYSEYYIRRVRISSTDPLFKMLAAQGIPHNPEVGQDMATATTFVLEFPIAGPSSKNSEKISALEQLEYWKTVKMNYTEHNPSCTIYVNDDEWLRVASWVYDNWDIIGGISFLPREKHAYQLAPYESITRTQYEKLSRKMPRIDFNALTQWEEEDNTEGSRALACAGNVCEITL
jgi:ribonucleoside-diphosphate reductase alpha chain